MPAWNLTLEPSALPQKVAAQVLSKLAVLREDPTPDVKKHLTHIPGRLHRIRSGDCRLFYTFEPLVNALAVRKRDEGTDDDTEGERLGGLAPELPVPAAAAWLLPPWWVASCRRSLHHGRVVRVACADDGARTRSSGSRRRSTPAPR